VLKDDGTEYDLRHLCVVKTKGWENMGGLPTRECAKNLREVKGPYADFISFLSANFKTLRHRYVFPSRECWKMGRITYVDGVLSTMSKWSYIHLEHLKKDCTYTT
jgi:hypothetical protein